MMKVIIGNCSTRHEGFPFGQAGDYFFSSKSNINSIEFEVANSRKLSKIKRHRK